MHRTVNLTQRGSFKLNLNPNSIKNWENSLCSLFDSVSFLLYPPAPGKMSPVLSVTSDRKRLVKGARRQLSQTLLSRHSAGAKQQVFVFYTPTRSHDVPLVLLFKSKCKESCVWIKQTHQLFTFTCLFSKLKPWVSAHTNTSAHKDHTQLHVRAKVKS